MSRRVVITGVGLVSSLGIGTEANWNALCVGRCGIRTVTRFDVSQFACQIAGEIEGFDPLNYIDKKDVKKMDTFIQYAVAAADFASASPAFVAVSRSRDSGRHCCLLPSAMTFSWARPAERRFAPFAAFGRVSSPPPSRCLRSASP